MYDNSEEEGRGVGEKRKQAEEAMTKFLGSLLLELQSELKNSMPPEMIVKQEKQIIDKLVKSGSYTNAEECKPDEESLDEEARAWYRRWRMLELEITPVQEQHEEESSMDGELRTAIKWLFAYLVLSLISGQIGWSLFFFS